MAVFETWLKSDLKKPVTVKQLPGVVFSQDSKANKVGVIVTDGGKPVTLSGTVYGYVIKPNGTTVEVAGAIDSEDASRASFVMPQEAYAVGHISIVIKLSSTGSVVTTLAACTAYVYQSRKGTGVVPTGTVIPDLQDLEEVIAEAEAATAAAETAAESVAAVIAADYSDLTFPVKAGTLCYHEDALYKANQPIASSESWTSEHWTATTVEEELNAKNRCLYKDIMGVGSAAPAGRTVIVDKNIVELKYRSSSTTYRCVRLFGTPADLGASFSNADLASETFYPLGFDTEKFDLFITAACSDVYSSAKSTLCIATKNETTGTVTKAWLANDTGNKIKCVNVFEACPDVKVNGNFAMYLDTRSASQTTTFVFWFSVEPKIVGACAENFLPDITFNLLDYGKNWKGSVNGKTVTKHGNKLIFSSDVLGSFRYFSMLSDQLYVSSGNNVTSIPEDAFTLHNKLKPHATYEIIVRKIGLNAVGGNYIAVYDKAGNVLSDKSIDINSNAMQRMIFTNDTIPAALCMQCNSTSQGGTAELEIVIMEILPDFIYSETNEKRLRAARWTGSSTITPVSLLHFSDIHGRGAMLTRILAFKAAHADLINDTICTGDMQLATVNSNLTFWTDRDTSGVLVALGNHDVDSTNEGAHTKADYAETVARWFTDADTRWGVTIEEDASWYYKDYTSGGVRLIVLDCNRTPEEGGTAQKEWLETVLADANTNNLAVIIAAHYVYLGANGEYTQYLNNKFTRAGMDATAETSYFWSPTTYTQTVQTFINNGGKFICWLAGHQHTDIMRYPTNYPNQLIVQICSASPDGDQTKLTTLDMYRKAGTPMQDAFNIVTIDTNNSRVTFARIGADLNMYGRPRDIVTYNYDTHEFIA